MSEVAGDPFASLSDAVPALVWIADQSGRWLHANERWRDLTGDDPARPPGDGWRGDVHPDDLPDLLAAQDAALAAGEAFEIVHRVLAADGEYRWMLSRGAPRRSSVARTVTWAPAWTSTSGARWASSCASRRPCSTPSSSAPR